MTVFKCYMKILKNNIGLVSIYLVIFFRLPWHFRHPPKKRSSEDLKRRGSTAIADQMTAHFLTHLRIIFKPSIMYMRFPQNLQ